jgi:hypothetical protein
VSQWNGDQFYNRLNCYQDDVLVGYLDPVHLTKHQRQPIILSESRTIRLHSVTRLHCTVRQILLFRIPPTDHFDMQAF